MASRGKKYQQAFARVDQTKRYPLAQAIPLVKQTSYTTFPGTVEAHLTFTVTGIRQPVTLPHGTGKAVKILVFAAGAAGEVAKQAGADYVGGEDLVEKIAAGWSDYDCVIATPEMMPTIAKIAKSLGPRGLMPNPKNGTISDTPAQLVKEIKGGRIEIRSEASAPVAHLAVGRTTYTDEQLIENIRALLDAIGSARIKRLTITSTMGPGIKVDLLTSP